MRFWLVKPFLFLLLTLSFFACGNDAETSETAPPSDSTATPGASSAAEPLIVFFELKNQSGESARDSILNSIEARLHNHNAWPPLRVLAGCGFTERGVVRAPAHVNRNRVAHR